MSVKHNIYLDHPLRISLEKDIFVKDVDIVNQSLELSEAIIIYLKTLYVKVKKINLKVAVKSLFKFIGLLALLVAITPIVGLLYFVIVLPLRYLLLSKAKKVSIMYSIIESRIKTGKYTIENLKSSHKEIKIFLDKHSANLDRMKGEQIITPSINVLLDEMKKIEFMIRMAAYPERNSIPLSYNELRELSSLMVDFECASEQRDVYNKIENFS